MKHSKIILMICFLIINLSADAKVINLNQATDADTIDASIIAKTILSAEAGDCVSFKNKIIRGKLEVVQQGTIQIECSINFDNITFLDNVSFNRVIFQAEITFKNCTFNKRVEFIETEFKSTNFYKALFKDQAYFSGSVFNNKTMMNYVRFFEGADFDSSQFQYISFKNSVFRENSVFHRASFKSTISLEGANFEKTVDFRNAIFDFKSELILQGMTFQLMRVGWNQIKDNIIIVDTTGKHTPIECKEYLQVANIYLQLQRNFRDLGQWKDHDVCYYELMDIERKRDTFFGKQILGIFKITCGYGVKPERTIICSTIIIILMGLAFWRKGAILRLKDENHEKSKYKRLKNALYFSANTFSTVGYGDWYPSEKKLQIPIIWIKGELIWLSTSPFPFIRIKWITIPIVSYRLLATFEGLIGWILMAIFLVSLGKVWIR